MALRADVDAHIVAMSRLWPWLNPLTVFDVPLMYVRAYLAATKASMQS